MAHKWADWRHNLCQLRVRNTVLWSGPKNQNWPTNGWTSYITPTPQRLEVWYKMTGGKRMGGVATQPLPTRGPQSFGGEHKLTHKWVGWLHNPSSPTLHSLGQNHRWPTNGRFGYTTCANWGSPKLPRRAHNSVDWLHNTSCPTLHNVGHNQRWPTNGWIGYITSAN